jgi:hypothetical protein
LYRYSADNSTRASTNIGAGIEFTCSTDKSAILVLPDGASNTNLKQPGKFLNLLTDDVALRWLEATGSSSLTLVTGCVKSRSWGVAAVSNTSRQASVSLNFSAAKVGGQFTGSYSWQSSSGGHYRAGPKPPSNINNQCVFVRGFKVSSRRRLMPGGKGKMKIADVSGSSMPDSGSAKGQRTMPSGGDHASRSGASEASQQSQDAPAKAEGGDSANDDEVFVMALVNTSQVRYLLRSLRTIVRAYDVSTIIH